MDNENNIFVMEIHYDNPDKVPGSIDSSGIRVFYTNTLRKYEAGSLLLGDITVARAGQTVRNGFEYEHSCSSACTGKFSRPINIYASGLHMHTTGMEIYENKFNKNASFIETIKKVSRGSIGLPWFLFRCHGLFLTYFISLVHPKDQLLE